MATKTKKSRKAALLSLIMDDESDTYNRDLLTENGFDWNAPLDRYACLCQNSDQTTVWILTEPTLAALAHSMTLDDTDCDNHLCYDLDCDGEPQPVTWRFSFDNPNQPPASPYAEIVQFVVEAQGRLSLCGPAQHAAQADEELKDILNQLMSAAPPSPFSPRELATVLYALRSVDHRQLNRPELFCSEHPPLNHAEIDSLCERLSAAKPDDDD